jgi:hypothetical protein
MPRRANKNILAVSLIAAGSVSLAALGIYANNAKIKPSDLDQKNASIQTQQPLDITVKPDDEKKEDVKTLKPEFQGDDLKFKEGKSKVPAGEDPMVFAVTEYLKTLDAMPKEARALSVKVENGVASLNLSKEVPVGVSSMDEMTLVKGVLATFKQFPTVQAVKFLVEGEPVESFGHLDLTEPQPITPEN